MLDQTFEQRMKPSLDRMRLMSVTHLVALYETLVTLKDVAAALTNRPTFIGRSNLMNDAGAFLDDIHDDLGMNVEAVVEALRSVKGCGSFEIEKRARILIQHNAIYADNIPEVAATAAALAVPDRHQH
ncbi:hypothetical protein [Bosea vaviloviae]|uniref:Uncharacterized protein n=1 Tax=Bosea vaviloviae TaxID=1526658 RepID=A0A0N1N371_9HYPH|nr:hypothetical protein [Bosea vaviloviae]KPH79318.1 hypothetical protein AE618_18605 [Bosea vaviloviae]